MLRTILVKSLAKYLVSVNDSNNVEKIGGGASKVGRTKSKNSVIPNFWLSPNCW